MPSQYRHRRSSNPASAFPGAIEPGEIAVNTANRQLVVGDANASSLGTTLALLATRMFDARGQYAVGDYAWNGGQLYRAKATISPGAFNSANWDQVWTDAQSKAYADAGDAAVTTAFQNADTAIGSTVSGKVSKTGDVMTGPLTLPATTPTTLQAANRQYVDAAITAATGGGGATASGVANVPAGNISATDVQAAINELDTEKAPLSGAALVNPTSTTPAANDNSSKVANTAWFAGQASGSLPTMAGAAAPGTALTFSRGDHVHPTDTSRAPLTSPNFTGTPTAPTPANAADNSAALATTAWVNGFQITNIADGIVSYAKMAASAIATTAQFLANASQKILTTDRVWAAAPPTTLTDGSSVAPDLSTGINFSWTLGAAGRTLANPTNMKVGQTGLIYLIQDGTGGRTITTWGSQWKFPGGSKPVLSTAANSIDVLAYAVKSSTEIIGTFSAGFA